MHIQGITVSTHGLSLLPAADAGGDRSRASREDGTGLAHDGSPNPAAGTEDQSRTAGSDRGERTPRSDAVRLQYWPRIYIMNDHVGSVMKRNLSVIFPTDVDSSLRFVKFLVTGGMGGMIDMITLMFVVEVVHLPPVLGGVFSKEVSILSMFVVNQTWTFQETLTSAPREVIRRLVKSNMVRWIGGGVGVATLFVLYRWVGVWYLMANLAGIGVGFVFNFVFESLVTFEIHHEI